MARKVLARFGCSEGNGCIYIEVKNSYGGVAIKKNGGRFGSFWSQFYVLQLARGITRCTKFRESKVLQPRDSKVGLPGHDTIQSTPRVQSHYATPKKKNIDGVCRSPFLNPPASGYTNTISQSQFLGFRFLHRTQLS